MAYYGGHNNNNAHDYKLGIVTHLMAMGFSQEDCIEAARATNNKGVQEAFDYLSNKKNVGSSSSSSSSSSANKNNANHSYGGYNSHPSNNNNNNNNNYGNNYGNNSYGNNSYGGYNSNSNNNNNSATKPHYQRKASYNEAHFSQLKELGLGDNDAERREACRKHPDDMDGAMEYLYSLQKDKEQKKKNNNSNNSGNFWNRWGSNNNNNNSNQYSNNNNNNNYGGYQNSTSYKVNQIKQKYPELSDEKVRDLLDRHNGNVANTLKFIELKIQDERQKRLRIQRQREQEQKDDEDPEDQLAHLLMSLLSLAIVEDAGFCTASDENKQTVVNRLSRVEPKGQTALRDAVVVGIAHMLKVKALLMKLGTLKHKFVHVVLTDGEDTASKGSHNELKGFFQELGKELGDICKTYFIGVGLSWKEKQSLEQIAELGGNSAELFNCQDVEISDVFNRISIGLGIRRQIVAMEHQGRILAAKRDQLALEIRQNKFLVLFTLDMSGSMSGGRWRKVVQAVGAFMHGLKGDDIIGCVLFNEKPQLITDE